MSFASPFPDVEIPDVSVFDLLFGDIEDVADRPAVVDGLSGQSLLYGELKDRMETLARALVSRGIRPGEVIGLLCPNSPTYVVVFQAILRAGATATTINSLYTAREIADQLRDSGATHLFAPSLFLPQALEATATAGLPLERLVILDGAGEDEMTSLAGVLRAAADAALPDIDPGRTLAVLPYSSGTTGKAKGVMLTHRNLVANVVQSRELITVGADDRVLCVLPFFHIYGLNVLMNLSLAARACVVTLPRFDLADFLRTVAEHKATFLFIAPPVAVALAKHPVVDHYGLSSVRVVFSGAAPLDADLGHAVARRLGCTVRQGYGMSEMSPVSHAIPEDRDDIPLGSVGLTIPNMHCKIVDPVTGMEIDVPASGESPAGELCCRGPNVMLGYLGDPDATAQTLDADGYLHTGDLATVTAEGYVTIVDRVKELIKYKGHQVPPAELEALLLTHQSIADAAVIGVQDAAGEEVPKAFVVRQPGASLSADEVMAFVAERVAPFKKVREVAFVDAIPKSASGKILRRELRQQG